MTPYVSIDLETTGLDPSYCQILEFAAVIEDWESPVDQLTVFHAYAVHERIIGDPMGLAMNAKILERIARRDPGYDYLAADCLGLKLHRWLRGQICDEGEAVIAAGKNFAKFDLQFLQALPNFMVKFHHRSIDPVMFYWSPFEDSEPPSTKLCMERAGIASEVAHTAVEDAPGVNKMVRANFGVAV